MSVLKRMTDKFSHLGLQSNKSASAGGSPSSSSSLYVPGAGAGSRHPSVSHVLYSTDHRGSISTEATSSKSVAAAADAESAFPRKVAREKGTYKLNDFIIHRTLGMGSFGRVHLGEPRTPAPRRALRS
jgi:hypothetical protein